MTYIGEKNRKTANGFIQTHRLYQAKNCEGCPMRGPCHKATGNRILQRSPNLIRHRQKIKHLLESDLGLEKRRQSLRNEGKDGRLKRYSGTSNRTRGSDGSCSEALKR